eukprot:1141666-Pelagomonas_calceolata.AAC.2
MPVCPLSFTFLCCAGLVCLEIYKVLLEKPAESFRNTFANLALPLFAMAEPMPPKTIKYKVSEMWRPLEQTGLRYVETGSGSFNNPRTNLLLSPWSTSTFPRTLFSA